MSVFRFRLQRVLELREKSERQAAGRLAEARDAADAARQAQHTLEAMREQGARNLAVAQGGASTAGVLQNLSYVIEHLNRQIQEAHSVAATADENVRRLLGEFTAAVQERRVLDRLRERKREEWRADEVDADRQLMDGIALSRFVRRAAGDGAGE